MADFITPVLNIISVLCSCSANNRCCYLLDLQENKDALNTAMKQLKYARDDVKRRVDEAENNPNEPMNCNQEVNRWLKCVQAIEGEVVQLIQKADQEIQGGFFGGYRLKNCWTATKISKLVIRKLAMINDLMSKGSFVDIAYKLPPFFVQKEPLDLTVGMESMFDKVWRSLADDKVRVMGLYGCGGVGKTTLLKQINNEFLKSTTTTHGFDVVILVVMSKTLNIDTIQKEIGDKLGLSSSNRTSIFKALSKKNFVLLLDDIWERVDLQSIGVPRSESSKSKVVFTTRSETVCGLMDANKIIRVECLPWDEAWTLFQEKVGNDALDSHSKVPDLAKIVAKECGGLPLALITTGRAMSTKKTVQEWNHAITTLQRYASDFPGMGDEVLPLLQLSYNSLHNDTIKSCFLYCALYPEDWSIKKSKLVDYWIGEGIILLNEFGDIDEARNYGYDVIGNLKDACLLESGEDEETQVKMHDTIQDLAFWIIDKMLATDALNGTSERSWYNAERIYLLRFRHDVTKVPTPPLKSPNLLTLIFVWRPGTIRIPQNFFEFMPLLRVLDLSNSGMKTFPISITELLELEHLSLSKTHIQVIPEELRKLVKLKLLDFSYMMDLEKIPSGLIGSLLELRVLNLYRCSGADFWKTIEEVYKLEHLNDLGITISMQHSSTLTKLFSSSNKNLQMCTRSLHMFPSWSSSSSLSSSTTTLGVNESIKSVEKLELLCNLETLSLDTLLEVDRLLNLNHCYMDYQQHHQHLHSYFQNMHMKVRKENLYSYMVQHQQQQQHLGSCFQNLGEIQIRMCNSLKDLTWVGYAGNLKSLDVSYCDQLEELVIVVVDDFGGTTGGGDEIISSNKMMNNVKDIFKSLETLKMRELPILKSICSNALAFPCLEWLVVEQCPKLKKLPFNSGSNVNNTLRMIQGGPKWWSELQWGEKDHDNNELLKSKFFPYFVENSYFERKINTRRR